MAGTVQPGLPSVGTSHRRAGNLTVHVAPAAGQAQDTLALRTAARGTAGLSGLQSLPPHLHVSRLVPEAEVGPAVPLDVRSGFTALGAQTHICDTQRACRFSS